MDRITCTRRGLLALAFAMLPAAAAAQAVPTAAYANLSLAKSEAIMGGAPSRLSAILAQQQGLPAPQLSRSAEFRLAAGTPATVLPAIVRSAPRVSEAVGSGKPDIFGSVALAVHRTPMDQRWKRVERARVGGDHARFAESLRQRSELDRVEAVNRYVNARVAFVDDSRQFGREDVWATAAQTLRRGRGDCEDYAIAKMQLLRAAGLSDNDLYMVIVKDLVRRADHAVLVVRAGGKMVVLDNGTDRLLETAEVSDYRPMVTFAANRSWLHGYRRTLPPISIASADVKPLAPAAAP
ncbi:MAG TPA: transglutaminase-like cysteine peptidase [Sphingomicrobium sp.]|jgi:predicted transglutaminase-like cysteine proteinase|nr:transglutaminase-like cysteine peptidase [Sphingomicrobium sp.]